MNQTDKFRRTWKKSLLWMHRHIPMGLRTIAGIVLIFGGVLGFLPVLGFWMIPLGIAVIALDAKIVSKRFRRSSRNRKKHGTDGCQKRNEEEK